MKIAFGSDHAGYEYRQMLMAHARELGHEVIDYGTFSKESCDYPVYGHAVGAAVANGEADRGILVCGTGFGISLAANRIPGIRCANAEGAFYLMVTLPVDDAEKLQYFLLEEFEDHGETVMYAPGEGFYATPGKGRNEIRIAYVTNPAELRRSVELLGLGIAAYNARREG